MPVTPAKKLPVKDRERFFVNLYISAGAVSEKVSYCEKRACLKPGSGLKILKRKTIQQEIKDKMEPVRLEQFRQRILGEAAKLAENRIQENLSKTVINIRRMKIDSEVLEHELMMGVIGLDWQRFPDAKLNVIKTAYIVNGAMESGNTRLVIPKGGSLENDKAGLYTSHFNRLTACATMPQDAPLVTDEVFDLTPGITPAQSVPVTGTITSEGESIDEPTVKAKTDERVITVEIG